MVKWRKRRRHRGDTWKCRILSDPSLTILGLRAAKGPLASNVKNRRYQCPLYSNFDELHFLQCTFHRQEFHTNDSNDDNDENGNNDDNNDDNGD